MSESDNGEVAIVVEELTHTKEESGEVAIAMEEHTDWDIGGCWYYHQEESVEEEDIPTMVEEFTHTDFAVLLRLIKENKVSAWLESTNDSSASSVSAEDAETFNKFFPDGFVHIMWKEILKGDLESVTSWITTTKERGEDIHEVDFAHKMNALHYAILFNKEEIVVALLESEKWDRIDPQELLTDFRRAILVYSPPSGPINIGKIIDGMFWKVDDLDSAVNWDRLENVKLLIQHGVSPMMNCETIPNQGYCSILERAILDRKRPMVMAMLNKGGPPEAGGGGGAGGGAWELDKEKLKDMKDCTNNFEPLHRHTPFAKLVENLPDVAAMALDHCISSKGSPHKKDYEISFDCSLLESETSNANKFYRGFPCAYLYDLARHDEETDCSLKGWFDAVEDKNYDAYEKHQRPLYKVMQSNDSVLLNHPVVQALLEKKLKMFGWWLYYFNLFLYIWLVSLLTAFLLILPNPQDPQCVQHSELEGNFSLAEEEDFEFSLENLTSGLECSMGLDSNLPALSALKTVTLILTFLRLILELYQLYSRKLVGYFNNWINWVEFAEYISIIFFLFSVERGKCFCPQTWEWELGVVSLALSWVALIAWFQAMHWIGIYVTILLRIIASFARVAIFGLLLVVGFGLTFYLLFYQPPQDESVNEPSIFSSPLRAILSVISLTAGEFDTGGVFYSDSADSSSPGRQYESLAFVIWLAGVIIMSVLFNNLLVGLAVGEVDGALEEARITIIKQRIELVLTQEEQFPEFIHRRIIQTKPIVVHPNQRNKVQLWLLAIPIFGFTLCSFICCNNNHSRYWANISDSLEAHQSKKYKKVPELIEKTGSAAEVEDSPVTKQAMKDELKEQVAALEDKLTLMEDKTKDQVSVLKDELKKQVTTLKDELKEQVTMMEDKINEREEKMKKQLTVMQDMLLEINEQLKAEHNLSTV